MKFIATLIFLSVFTTSAFAKTVKCYGHYVPEFSVTIENNKVIAITGLSANKYEAFNSIGKARLGNKFAVMASAKDSEFIRGNVDKGIALMLDGSKSSDGHVGTLSSGGELDVIFCK